MLQVFHLNHFVSYNAVYAIMGNLSLWRYFIAMPINYQLFIAGFYVSDIESFLWDDKFWRIYGRKTLGDASVYLRWLQILMKRSPFIQTVDWIKENHDFIQNRVRKILSRWNKQRHNPILLIKGKRFEWQIFKKSGINNSQTSLKRSTRNWYKL